MCLNIGWLIVLIIVVMLWYPVAKYVGYVSTTAWIILAVLPVVFCAYKTFLSCPTTRKVYRYY
jgi:hypothetical protein